MRWFALVLVFLPSAAWAQAPSSSPRPSAKGDLLEARRGFQMHIVPFTAFALPFGNATGGPRDALLARYS